MAPLLQVNDLTKQFGDFKAVNQISFSVQPGEIVGLLGPNGAGKTTTIQMLLGLMTPTQGKIEYFGLPLNKHREEIMQKINHTSGYARLPWRLTVRENLTVFAHLYEVTSPSKKIDELAALFETKGILSRPFKDLSAGQVTRVTLMKAFLNDPKMLLLDEPTASLDPDIAETIRNYILSERKKRQLTVLVTSHNMREVEEMCDWVIFLHLGKILAVDTPQGLATRNNQSQVHLMVTDGLKRLIVHVKKLGFSYQEQQRFIKITLPEAEVARFLNGVNQIGVNFSEIEIVRPSLEDFFLSVSHGRSL